MLVFVFVFDMVMVSEIDLARVHNDVEEHNRGSDRLYTAWDEMFDQLYRMTQSLAGLYFCVVFFLVFAVVTRPVAEDRTELGVGTALMVFVVAMMALTLRVMTGVDRAFAHMQSEVNDRKRSDRELYRRVWNLMDGVDAMRVEMRSRDPNARRPAPGRLPNLPPDDPGFDDPPSGRSSDPNAPGPAPGRLPNLPPGGLGLYGDGRDADGPAPSAPPAPGQGGGGDSPFGLSFADLLPAPGTESHRQPVIPFVTVTVGQKAPMLAFAEAA